MQITDDQVEQLIKLLRFITVCISRQSRVGYLPEIRTVTLCMVIVSLARLSFLPYFMHRTHLLAIAK